MLLCSNNFQKLQSTIHLNVYNSNRSAIRIKYCIHTMSCIIKALNTDHFSIIPINTYHGMLRYLIFNKANTRKNFLTDNTCILMFICKKVNLN